MIMEYASRGLSYRSRNLPWISQKGSVGRGDVGCVSGTVIRARVSSTLWRHEL